MTETLDHPATATATPQATMSELVSGILGDAQNLVRQQVVMLRSELKEDIRRSTSAAKYMGIGIGTASVGGLFLAVAVVHLLAWLMPTLPIWACWAIAGGLLVAGGLVLLVVGKRIFDSFNPLPDKTFNALQENVSWITTKHPN